MVFILVVLEGLRACLFQLGFCQPKFKSENKTIQMLAFKKKLEGWFPRK